MEDKIEFDEEDQRALLGEMIAEQLELQSAICEQMLDLRLELTKSHQRVELLRILNKVKYGKHS